MFDIDDALKTIKDYFGMFDIHGPLKTIWKNVNIAFSWIILPFYMNNVRKQKTNKNKKQKK